MSAVLEAGPNLELNTWNQLRRRAIFDYYKWDPQSEDKSVLARYPLFISSNSIGELQSLAEKLSAEALAAEKELLCRPGLWRALGISRNIRRVLQASDPNCEAEHVRVMRYDFHFTGAGWRISEVNADVPGGYVEGAGWNSLFAEHCEGVKTPPNPSRNLVKAIRERVHAEDVVALVHATNYSDDRQVMMHLAKELRRAGLRPALAGPQNIGWSNGAVYLKTETRSIRIDAAIRFFPAEWLSQLPTENRWVNWFACSKTILCNPGRAILLQSKRFPLVWSDLNTKLATWRRLLPITVCPKTIRGEEPEDWVIKPAFGRVGEEIGIRNVTSDAEYGKLRREAEKNPEQWIAQQRFETLPVQTEDGNVYPCVGAFTVNGKFAGIYGRANRTPLINQEAQDVAVLVRDEIEQGE